MPDPYSITVEPFCHDLPDTCAIKFTRADPHRSKIISPSSRSFHTPAIIDWERLGWLPEYWGDRKAQCTASEQQEWSELNTTLS
jgi:hypothetical protein